MQEAVDLTTNRFRGGVSSNWRSSRPDAIEPDEAQAQHWMSNAPQLEHALRCSKERASDSQFRAVIQWAAGPQFLRLPAELLRAGRYRELNVLVQPECRDRRAKRRHCPISLTAIAGFEGTSMTSLFSWRTAIASLAASAITPLFTGGRTKAGVDSMAVYRRTLGPVSEDGADAYQEVDDQLAAAAYSGWRRRSQRRTQ